MYKSIQIWRSECEVNDKPSSLNAETAGEGYKPYKHSLALVLRLSIPPLVVWTIQLYM